MKKAIVYIHGKGGNAEEADHYRPLFPDCDVIGFSYKSQTPWEAREEFAAYLEELRRQYDAVSLIAVSIGAYFAMSAAMGGMIENAYLISPIVDMEQLICDMMRWANVTESELREKGEIETPFGETLSWEYLSYVRAHPIAWRVPTHILYAENDHLTSRQTITAFSEKIGASLHIMAGGEHWFHTKEQMAYLDAWISE